MFRDTHTPDQIRQNQWLRFRDFSSRDQKKFADVGFARKMAAFSLRWKAISLRWNGGMCVLKVNTWTPLRGNGNRCLRRLVLGVDWDGFSFYGNETLQ